MKLREYLVLIFLFLAFPAGIVAQGDGKRRGLDSLDLLSTEKRTNSPTTPELPTPVEIDGYKFFESGRLKGLRLGVSTIADVIKRFGSDCDLTPCLYDSNWSLSVEYFKADSRLIEALNKKNERQFEPKKDAVGKISAISLWPKRRMFFEQVRFPESFTKVEYKDTGWLRSGENGIVADLYWDPSGVQYWVFNRNDGTSKATDKSIANARKGDLISIKYTITEDKEFLFFDEVK